MAFRSPNAEGQFEGKIGPEKYAREFGKLAAGWEACLPLPIPRQRRPRGLKPPNSPRPYWPTRRDFSMNRMAQFSRYRRYSTGVVEVCSIHRFDAERRQSIAQPRVFALRLIQFRARRTVKATLRGTLMNNKARKIILAVAGLMLTLALTFAGAHAQAGAAQSGGAAPTAAPVKTAGQDPQFKNIQVLK